MREAVGTFNMYLEFFGVKPDSHTGASSDKMRAAMTKLCDMNVFASSASAIRRVTPNNGFLLPFMPEYGWESRDRALGILMTIREIENATQYAKQHQWTGIDNLIEVTHLIAYLRAYMESDTVSIMPQDRWSHAIGLVDVPTCMSALKLTELRLSKQLKRMEECGYARYQRVELIPKNKRRKNHDLLIVVNNSGITDRMLSRARTSLQGYYQGYEIVVR